MNGTHLKSYSLAKSFHRCYYCPLWENAFIGCFQAIIHQLVLLLRMWELTRNCDWFCQNVQNPTQLQKSLSSFPKSVKQSCAILIVLLLPMCGNLNFMFQRHFCNGRWGHRWLPLGSLQMWEESRRSHFFKLLTGNYVKIWDQCDIMAIVLLNWQFARFTVGKFFISSCSGAATGNWCWDVKFVFMHFWKCPRRRRRGQRH